MTKQYYIYNPARPLTDDEQKVGGKGYNFVSTTELGPNGELNEHRHSSDNTHEIIYGRLNADKMHKGMPVFRPFFRIVGMAIKMPARVNYQGQAGPEGCVFVEGHKVLSPTTAERFEKRGTVVKATESTPGAFAVTG